MSAKPMSAKRLALNLLLGAVTCFLLIGVSTPSIAKVVSAPTQAASHSGVSESLVSLATHLQEAESTLLAQGMEGTMMSYGAVLRSANVVPTAPSTAARGAVGAVLSGNRLVVRGSFRNLSSPLRDYATDPVNPPNPNITSAFHIHRGAPTENGPFQYALQVMLDESGMGGMAMGEYTLTPEQLQALADGMLYIDVHTTQNRAGELRGILMPY